ncbi:MAG: malate synthase A [Jatrophihabitans sp.]
MTNAQVSASQVDHADEILTSEAIAFVAGLQRSFGARRDELLAGRPARQRAIADAGSAGAEFLASTRAIRTDLSWRVAPIPPALQNRRVEMTGPTERKMAINALNSGAQVWLADLEDANTPHWANVVSGQVNLRDAVTQSISFTAADGRPYKIKDKESVPVVVVRPRGWHLTERHIIVDGVSAAGALVDFGLFFFHNAAELAARGAGPFFYLPKMESHLEARLWADVFAYAEAELGIRPGTIRATVLIETIPAAFEMEEILYELRDYAAGLNAGRWDYLFSLIKVFRSAGDDYVLPDRSALTMTAPFMRAYTELLVSTCHRRGASAIGGMAAFIPSRRDEDVNAVATAKVREDKRREATDGFDGSWVAHPDLVSICAEEFDAILGERRNQIDRLRADVLVTPGELLVIPRQAGDVTAMGLRNDVAVALRYLAAWLAGNGAVGINNLMEDAATSEISRAQVWQWVHAGVELETGQQVTAALVQQILAEEVALARVELADSPAATRLDDAAGLFLEVALADDFIEFLTLPAMALID